MVQTAAREDATVQVEPGPRIRLKYSQLRRRNPKLNGTDKPKEVVTV